MKKLHSAHTATIHKRWSRPKCSSLAALTTLLRIPTICMLFAVSSIHALLCRLLYDYQSCQELINKFSACARRGMSKLGPSGRVFGGKFAEMPFVATKAGYRREGNCKRLLKVCCMLHTGKSHFSVSWMSAAPDADARACYTSSAMFKSALPSPFASSAFSPYAQMCDAF